MFTARHYRCGRARVKPLVFDFSAIAETCASQLGDSVAALPGSAALGQLMLMK